MNANMPPQRHFKASIPVASAGMLQQQNLQADSAQSRQLNATFILLQ